MPIPVCHCLSFDYQPFHLAQDKHNLQIKNEQFCYEITVSYFQTSAELWFLITHIFFF